MRQVTLAGIALSLALGQAVAQTGGTAPGGAGSTSASPATGAQDTQRGAGGDRVTTPRAGASSGDRASSGSTMRTRERRTVGKVSRAGEERFRRELAECNSFSGDTRRSCVAGMHAARREGLYRD